MTPDHDLVRRLRRRLLKWFGRERRDLPWRRTRDAYRILVSETMLQQTQVATVLRYYKPFLAAFPTVTALAAADEQEVLRVWQGLGYYRRARHLHRAARQLVACHGAQIPNDPEALCDLPGIGRYTLGAVLSQAYDRRLPILEANSRRVLCRLFGCPRQRKRAPVERRLWRLAESLLPWRRVGEFNQALMELGSLVCTPSVPLCSRCPLAADCAARRLGLEDRIPARPIRRAPVTVDEVAVVVGRRRRYLLVQRPHEDRWGGLWEFPRGRVAGRDTHEEAARRLLPEMTGVRARLGRELLTLRHSFTHHRITLRCFEARYLGGTFRPGFYLQGRWVKQDNLLDYPVSSPQRRLIQGLASGHPPEGRKQ